MKSIEVLLPSVRPLLQQLDVPRPVAQLDLGVEENKQAQPDPLGDLTLSSSRPHPSLIHQHEQQTILISFLSGAFLAILGVIGYSRYISQRQRNRNTQCANSTQRRYNNFKPSDISTISKESML